MKPKKILITGGAGFIGTHLANNLFENDIIIVDNFTNSSKLQFLHKPEIIFGDITNYHVMLPLIQSTDIVIHLAGISNVMSSISHPEITYDYNIYGTQIISQICRKFNKKLIFASSQNVYGEQLHPPVFENAVKRPKNPYAFSKYVGEAIVSTIPKHSIIRLANVYGHGDHGRVIPIFIKNALEGNEFVIYGKNKIVDFIYIDDVIDIIKKLLDYENITINVGSGFGHTIQKVASDIIKFTDSTSKIKIVESHKMVTNQFIADISKAKKLNWEPKVILENGLKKIIEEYKNGKYNS